MLIYALEGVHHPCALDSAVGDFSTPAVSVAAVTLISSLKHPKGAAPVRSWPSRETSKTHSILSCLVALIAVGPDAFASAMIPEEAQFHPESGFVSGPEHIDVAHYSPEVEAPSALNQFSSSLMRQRGNRRQETRADAAAR
jgi:hypothetical protein